MSREYVAKSNVSEEHRHMIRLSMVRHRLPGMPPAAARMTETAMEAEQPYTYRMSRKVGASGNGERRVGLAHSRTGTGKARAATALVRADSVVLGRAARK